MKPRLLEGDYKPKLFGCPSSGEASLTPKELSARSRSLKSFAEESHIKPKVRRVIWGLGFRVQGLGFSLYWDNEKRKWKLL